MRTLTQKLNPYLIKSVAVGALGGLLFGFDTAVIAGSLRSLRALFVLSPLQVGLTAVMQTTRRALRVMLRQGGGVIVNTASISGLFGDYGIAAYSAMKAGVVPG